MHSYRVAPAQGARDMGTDSEGRGVEGRRAGFPLTPGGVEDRGRVNCIEREEAGLEIFEMASALQLVDVSTLSDIHARLLFGE